MFRPFHKAVVRHRHKHILEKKHILYKTLLIKGWSWELSLTDIREGMLYILAEIELRV